MSQPPLRPLSIAPAARPRRDPGRLACIWVPRAAGTSRWLARGRPEAEAPVQEGAPKMLAVAESSLSANSRAPRSERRDRRCIARPGRDVRVAPEAAATRSWHAAQRQRVHLQAMPGYAGSSVCRDVAERATPPLPAGPYQPVALSARDCLPGSCLSPSRQTVGTLDTHHVALVCPQAQFCCTEKPVDDVVRRAEAVVDQLPIALRANHEHGRQFALSDAGGKLDVDLFAVIKGP